MHGECIDLHMHSHYSDDGEFSPAELVRQCAERGIKIMAISDHNCARANAEGAAAAAAAGITYIPSIEIDCTFAGVNFHVLGYGIDAASEDFAGIEQNIEAQGEKASHIMLEATRRLGFAITEAELNKLAEGMFHQSIWTGEMFGEVLLGKPEYAEHPLLMPYRPGGARSDNPFVNFYWDFYSQGKPCYAPIAFPTLPDTVALIHRNGGRAVLAHPGVNLKGHDELLDALTQTGIDGVEAYSSYHTDEERRFYADKVRAAGLFVTCGSDYHGKTKPSIRLGGHGCPLTDEEMLGELQSLL